MHIKWRPREVAFDDVALFGLFATFGVSSWVTINGAFSQLPLFATQLPEGWAIGSYLAVSLQMANVFVVAETVAARRWHLPPAGVSIVLLVGGMIATVCLGALWDWTAVIFGTSHSVGLLLFVFLGGGVDCTTSVVYWTLISPYSPLFTTALGSGEALGGSIVGFLALIQDPARDPPRFDVLPFFIIVVLLMAASLVALLVIQARYPPPVRRVDVAASMVTKVPEVLEAAVVYTTPSAPDAPSCPHEADLLGGLSTPDGEPSLQSFANPTKLPTSPGGSPDPSSCPPSTPSALADQTGVHREAESLPVCEEERIPLTGSGSVTITQLALQLWWPMVVQMWANLVQNGIIPSGMTYAFLRLEDGNQWMSRAIIAQLVLSPTAHVLVAFVRCPHLLALSLVSGGLTVFFVYAGVSTDIPLQHTSSGGPLIMLCLVTMQVVIGYTKTNNFYLLKDLVEPSQHTMAFRLFGYATQVGSLVGSFGMLLLVDVWHVFQQPEW